MAIYHYHRSSGSRKKGKNSVFTAAYIRGDRMKCNRLLQSKNYQSRKDIVFKQCILPKEIPTWLETHLSDYSDSQVSECLWNMIEDVERRRDACLYYKDELALPVELDIERAISLTCKFVKTVLSVNGKFCDVGICWKDNNPHAVIIFPLRKFSENGFANKERKSLQELKIELLRCREKWAEFTNEALLEIGSDSRIDHRSHADRGLNKIPTIKVGKSKYISSQKLEKNIEINEINRQMELDKSECDNS